MNSGTGSVRRTFVVFSIDHQQQQGFVDFKLEFSAEDALAAVLNNRDNCCHGQAFTCDELRELIAMAEMESSTARVRLGCLYCDRDDYDGVREFPADWREIGEVQSYEEACHPVALDDTTRSVLNWETHLGICPECQLALDEEPKGEES